MKGCGVSTPDVPLEGLVVPAPVKELFLAEYGDYAYWEDMKGKVASGPVIVDLPVQTKASDEVFYLPFTIVSIDVLRPTDIVFTVRYNQKELYVHYVFENGPYPAGGTFTTDKYVFSLAPNI